MGKPMRNKKEDLEFENEEGSALVIALLCLLVLGVTSTAIVFTTQGEIMSSAAYKYSQQAFYVANAGVQRAVLWYNSGYVPHLPAADYDTTYFPVRYSGSGVQLTGYSGGSAVYPDSTIAADFMTNLGNQTLQADTKNSGVYDLSSSLIKYEPRSFLNPTTFDPYPSAIERWRVTSIGYWRTSANPIGEAQITAMIQNDGTTIFGKALWGKDGISLGGTNLIDSYDPRLGPYGGTNIGDMGTTGSDGLISVNGSVTVRGDMQYGPDGSYTQAGGSATISGGVMQLPEYHYFPPIPDFDVGTINVTVPTKKSETIPAGSYGAITLRAQAVLTLGAGDYYIDSIDMSALSEIHVTGATRLFIKSGMSLAGQSIMNDTGLPENLTIFYAGTDDVTLVGGTGFYGSVYAPDAHVTLSGTCDFFGSFIGKTVSDSGTPQVHFDEGSLNRCLLPQPFRVVTWSQDVY